MAKRIDSQWAAQFSAGAELVRRRYSVAFFLGNEPRHDALVKCVWCGTSMAIQVKGFADPPPKDPERFGPWILVGALAGGDPSDLFVVVHVPRPPEHFRYFIATRGELDAVKNPPPAKPRKKAGEPYSSKFSSDGVRWCDMRRFENAWDKLAHDCAASPNV